MKSMFLSAAILLTTIGMARAQNKVTITFQNSQGAGISSVDAAKAPSAVIGKAELEVAYTYKWIKQPTTKPDRITEDYMFLQTGKGLSKFYSYNEFRIDSLRALSTPDQPASIPAGLQGGVKWVLFCNYPEGKTTYTDKITTNFYRYEETMPGLDWRIGSETREVAGYACRKATCTFRGRQWTAWFAPEIPVNAGPWKLRGLPGLILAAEDSEGQFRFEAVGIRKSNEPIAMKEIRYLKTSREKFLSIEQKYNVNPYAFATKVEGMAFTVAYDDGRSFKEPDDEEYNPIER